MPSSERELSSEPLTNLFESRSFLPESSLLIMDWGAGLRSVGTRNSTDPTRSEKPTLHLDLSLVLNEEDFAALISMLNEPLLRNSQLMPESTLTLSFTLSKPNREMCLSTEWRIYSTAVNMDL